MNISLTPALSNFVQEKVASGLYNSASEVIRESLRLLISKEAISKNRIDMLNNAIDKGLEDLNADKIQDGDEAINDLINKYE